MENKNATAMQTGFKFAEKKPLYKIKNEYDNNNNHRRYCMKTVS